jgi:hypothetical protein
MSVRESFRGILETAQHKAQSTLAIGLAPRMDRLPLPILRHDEPLLPYGRAVIDATSDVACAYVFHLGAYLALGAAGAIALERTLAYVPVPLVKILHAPFATADFVRASFDDAFNADAVTLAAGAPRAVIEPYLQHPSHAAFVQVPPQGKSRPLLSLNKAYPGQVGSYKSVGEDYNTLGVMSGAHPELHWYWGTPLFDARGDDFQTALRTAALGLRQPPSA